MDVPWLLFLASMPGRTGSARLRVWRALKDLGAGVLRDGVHLLPNRPTARAALDALTAEVIAAGGTAQVLTLGAQAPEQERQFCALLSREADYAALQGELGELRRALAGLAEPEARRRLRQLERRLATLAQIDYFPGAAAGAAGEALAEVRATLEQQFSPGEPVAEEREVPRLARARFRRRRWATRQRLWADRVASAWLIRRFIDPRAEFVWLAPGECARNALGFDFPDATFTHVGDKVTFEVLLASFGLDADAGLVQLGSVIHYLDVGGSALPPEAPGLESVLTGMRETCTGDDALLAAMTPVLDALYQRFSGEAAA